MSLKCWSIFSSYPFLLAPSKALSTALLLDFGVSDRSDSVADRCSVNLLSVAWDKNTNNPLIQWVYILPTNILFPQKSSWLYRFEYISDRTHCLGYSGLSVWSHHCSALLAQSVWTAPPRTTLLSPPSAPCKHFIHWLILKTQGHPHILNYAFNY